MRPAVDGADVRETRDRHGTTPIHVGAVAQLTQNIFSPGHDRLADQERETVVAPRGDGRGRRDP